MRETARRRAQRKARARTAETAEPARPPPRAGRGDSRLAAASGGEVRGRALDERGVLAAHGFGDARPPVLHRPADSLAAQSPAQVGIAEQPGERLGQRDGIVVGDSRPVTPWRTVVCSPPAREATTGLPQAIASSATMPKDS